MTFELSAICSHCSREWPAEMFREGHRQCRSCQREKKRAYKAANPAILEAAIDYLKEH